MKLKNLDIVNVGVNEKKVINDHLKQCIFKGNWVGSCSSGAFMNKSFSY